jgi:hypothetical protein
VRGIVLTPRGSRRGTLVEHVIKLPHLQWVLMAPLGGSVVDTN